MEASHPKLYLKRNMVSLTYNKCNNLTFSLVFENIFFERY